MGAVDWQPLVAAGAAFVVALTPAVVALVRSFSNTARIDVLADGQRHDLDAVVRALERLEAGRAHNAERLDAVHSRLDQLATPPSAGHLPPPLPPAPPS